MGGKISNEYTNALRIPDKYNSKVEGIRNSTIYLNFMFMAVLKSQINVRCWVYGTLINGTFIWENAAYCKGRFW